MKLTRRTFLRGAGGVAVSLPLLEATSGRAWAQNEGPRRFVFFHTPQGTVMDAWRPTGTETDWALSQILEPLAPFKTKLNVVSGLNNDVNYLNRRSNGHNAASRTLLTCQPFADNVDANGNLRPEGQQVGDGSANGPSLDQVLAGRLPAGSRFNSLDLAIGGSWLGENRILHAGANDPVSLFGNPNDVFSRLFADLPAPGTGGSGEPPPPPPPLTTIDRIRSRRGSVLDTVNASFSRLRAQLGAVDRDRLDAHADKIRVLETRYPNDFGDSTFLPSGECEQPVIELPSNYESRSAQFENSSALAMIDQMVMALTCDMTRVGTLQFTQMQSPTFPWLGVQVPAGSDENWHAMIHNFGNHTQTKIRVMTWYAEMFARLLERMDAIEEGDRTMLDNSLVMWVSEFSDGSGHYSRDLPFVFAGGLGGAVPTNRYIQTSDRNHADLYTAILNAFGFGDQSFGWADLNGGPLPGFAA